MTACCEVWHKCIVKLKKKWHPQCFCMTSCASFTTRWRYAKHNLMNPYLTVSQKRWFTVFKILVFFLHTYHFTSEDIASSTGVVWITVVFVLCSFWSINFEGLIHLHYMASERLIILLKISIWGPQIKVIHIWEGMRVSKWWENLNF